MTDKAAVLAEFQKPTTPVAISGGSITDLPHGGSYVVSIPGTVADVDAMADEIVRLRADVVQLAQVRAALTDLSDLTLTQGHPEFGIECTAMAADRFETVTNQPDPVTAIIAAVAALNSPSAGAPD